MSASIFTWLVIRRMRCVLSWAAWRRVVAAAAMSDRSRPSPDRSPPAIMAWFVKERLPSGHARSLARLSGGLLEKVLSVPVWTEWTISPAAG
ncbi:hypothetical protein [Methylobacterium tarhaniae]|uniref:hypothetical protein n=1 Tax=Methylobacterium tarhaniae TaxID=1187852 RepID=UPI00142DE409|nr:hypothetical protein [Methylobacterium tarhaniae]